MSDDVDVDVDDKLTGEELLTTLEITLSELGYACTVWRYNTLPSAVYAVIGELRVVVKSFDVYLGANPDRLNVDLFTSDDWLIGTLTRMLK